LARPNPDSGYSPVACHSPVEGRLHQSSDEHNHADGRRHAEPECHQPETGKVIAERHQKTPEDRPRHGDSQSPDHPRTTRATEPNAGTSWFQACGARFGNAKHDGPGDRRKDTGARFAGGQVGEGTTRAEGDYGDEVGAFVPAGESHEVGDH
jgi:hypothetical protein